MTAAAATARPARPAAPARHLEIAPSRAQRRARPRLAVALGTMTGIVVILLAQLGLSIAVADGAYRISSLQLQERDLGRQGEALAEQLESLQSPQFLARSAEALGMVASGSLPYIDLATGEITGKSTRSGGSILGRDGGLVANITIEGVQTVQPQAAQDAQAAEQQQEEAAAEGSRLAPGLHVVGDPGAPQSEGAGSDVSSGPGTLASPVTR